MDVKNLPDRIPYDDWIDSPLSIARVLNSAVFNGVRYIIDFQEIDNWSKSGMEGKCKPDLIKESVLLEKARKNVVLNDDTK